ncbi:MAG: GNAT family N-acetyltransferase [Lactobacillaceae bacterium]|nr:GNAT family N-acetyltransferase [Lactobacillaceae bacterium]
MVDEIKIVDGQAVDEIYKLAQTAFQKEPTGGKAALQLRVEHSHNYVFLTHGKLMSQVLATPFMINFYGTQYAADGIGYVASYPQNRGKGAINQLMAQILLDEYANGVVVSYLAPFSYQFYARYGYTQLFTQTKTTVASADFPAVQAKTGAVKVLTFAEALPILKVLYAQYRPFQCGALQREDWWWQCFYQLRMPDVQIAIYFDEDKHAQGYLLTRIEGDTYVIKEWVALNYGAVAGLTKFVGEAASAVTAIEFTSPEAGNTPTSFTQLLAEPVAKQEILPYMQGRIVNLTAFLATYPFLQNVGSIQFEVVDAVAPWNNGTFTLGQPTAATSIVLKGQIEAITELLFGYQNLANLVFTGSIQLSDLTVIEALMADLPTHAPVLPDYF